MGIKCLAQLFFEQGFYFKYEDHEKIAKGFDAGAIVRFQEYDNFKDVYGTHTVVTFSDGSAVSFNYKGEIDWLNEQTLGDEIDELNQEKLCLQEQLDSIWSILEGSNASGKEVEEIASLLDLKWSNHYGWQER